MGKEWNEIGISNDFLFGKVMRDPELCRELLEAILNVPIERVEYPEEQKTIDIAQDARSVRLDVYVADGNNTVDVYKRQELYALGTLGSRDGVNRTQAGGYGKIVELAEEYGLNLWFLETPKYERMYADEDYQKLYTESLSILRELQNGWTGDGTFQILCAEELDFDTSEADCYQDLIHLSAEGRENYTKLLCETFKATE